ncbi:DUF342 domain-containing protein [Halobacillus fulvus]|nr:DUF342 domain-containing protein [Halobacillus fulvus]
MEQTKEIDISVTDDQMEAYMRTEHLEDWTKEELLFVLQENRIVFGILEDALERFLEAPSSEKHLIAVGKDVVHGEDGTVTFLKQMESEVKQKDKLNFRDITTIPCVEEDEKIAELIPPVNGIPGKTVHGKVLPAKPGKPSRLKAGKNTTFKRADQSFYSEISGQISFDHRSISVQPLYEVRGDLDLRTGNLDFIGSIVIHGNVPTGFTVKAGADITVIGLVEGARIIAGGSIRISEGVSGIGKAFIHADQDVHAGYINKAMVEAGHDLFVEQSILHSDCVAQRSVYCQRGHIIGGTTSAGLHIEAKDIGNRMQTITGLYIGVNKKVEEQEMKLRQLLEDKQEEQRKLTLIGKKLEAKRNQSGSLSPKERITLLRQRNSSELAEKDIVDYKEQLGTLTSTIGDLENAEVRINENLYPNVHFGFGKYQYHVQHEHQNVRAIIRGGEIIVRKDLNED